MRRRAKKSGVALPVLLAGALCSGEVLSAEDGIPALLQFAEQYQNQSAVQGGEVRVPPPEKEPDGVSVQPSPARDALQRTIRAKDKIIAQQQSSLSELESELKAVRRAFESLQKELAEAREDAAAGTLQAQAPGTVDISPLGDIFRTLRRAVTGTPEEKELRLLLSTTRSEARQNAEALTESRQALEQLQKQFDDLKASDDALRQSRHDTDSDLHQRLADKELACSLLQEEYDISLGQNQMLRDEITMLRSQSMEGPAAGEDMTQTSLKNEYDTLIKKFEAVDALRVELEKDISLNASELASLKAQNATLALQLDEATRGDSVVSDELVSLNEQNASLLKQIEELRGQYTLSGDELSLLKEKNRTLTNQLDELTQAHTAAEKSRSLENAELASLKETKSTLVTQIDELRDKSTQTENILAQSRSELVSLKNENGLLTEKVSELKERNMQLSSLEKELLAHKQENEALRKQAKWQVSPETLTQEAGRRNYAQGSALGRDIVSLLEERDEWGIRIERDVVLAGIIDAFSGKFRLDQDELNGALAESDLAVSKAREKQAKKQQAVGEAFITQFRAKKGVKQSPSGFWYHVDYDGDDPIAEKSVVDIVVKESLTDGTVIQDMDLSGKVLSQPLEAYPPLFREAIGYLRNHGTITLVVPPELAYGDTGYPPKVPPDATMVYELRIDNVAPGSP
ncbi:FKBP-type peptidyl-prolyl cis-trans isomerase N-terminal domain-containing protein [Enterobacter cloacae]|uniref:FKBP-type peptidyl-prolyl cis-trans isomerase N-terminal domain-containing protein n=1 Tax=Enterobacter cloacae TaxID=550 RepID=UPI00345C71E4